jgi:hypothetical protein
MSNGGQSNSDVHPDEPISPQHPSNGWIDNGGWIGKSFSLLSFIPFTIYYQMEE